MYNPLHRGIEDDVLPLIRKHGCNFYAYRYETIRSPHTYFFFLSLCASLFPGSLCLFICLPNM